VVGISHDKGAKQMPGIVMRRVLCCDVLVAATQSKGQLHVCVCVCVCARMQRNDDDDGENSPFAFLILPIALSLDCRVTSRRQMFGM
jgi:hypothetical protein